MRTACSAYKENNWHVWTVSSYVLWNKHSAIWPHCLFLTSHNRWATGNCKTCSPFKVLLFTYVTHCFFLFSLFDSFIPSFWVRCLCNHCNTLTRTSGRACLKKNLFPSLKGLQTDIYVKPEVHANTSVTACYVSMGSLHLKEKTIVFYFVTRVHQFNHGSHHLNKMNIWTSFEKCFTQPKSASIH